MDEKNDWHLKEVLEREQKSDVSGLLIRRIWVQFLTYMAAHTGQLITTFNSSSTVRQGRWPPMTPAHSCTSTSPQNVIQILEKNGKLTGYETTLIEKQSKVIKMLHWLHKPETAWNWCPRFTVMFWPLQKFYTMHIRMYQPLATYTW